MEPSDAIDAESFWQGTGCRLAGLGPDAEGLLRGTGSPLYRLRLLGPQAASGSRTLTREKAHLLRAGGSGYGYRPELGPCPTAWRSGGSIPGICRW